MSAEAKRMFITEASEKPVSIREQREDHWKRFLSTHENQNRLIPSVSPQKHIPSVQFTLASCAVRMSKTCP